MTIMRELDPADVLDEAADLLLIKGRCLLDGKDPEGRYCVLGAIAATLGYDFDDGWQEEDVANHPATLALGWHVATSGALGEFYRSLPNTVSVVYAWNDGVSSLVQPPDDFEVIDTLRHVAKDIRNSR